MIRLLLAAIFPTKGDPKGRAAVKLISMAALLALAFCLVYAVIDCWRSISSRSAEIRLARSYSSLSAQPPAPASAGSVSQKYPAGMQPKFYSFYDINSDIRGWIQIEDTKIDYPVVQTSDNNYYLKKDFYKKDSFYGQTFLDYRDTLDSKNLIIYGHNMKDGRMFHDLVNYRRVDFYNAHPLIRFDTIYGDNVWKIFAVFIANTEKKYGDVFEYLYVDFGSDERFMQFIGEVRKRSVINTRVDVRPDDTILTLSTCTYEFKDARLVVMARRVRGGEDLGVEAAVKNPAPLYPDIWYKLYGGSKPPAASFG